MTSLAYRPEHDVDDDEEYWLWKGNSEIPSRKSFSMLTRATSFTTWDTSDISTKYTINNKERDEEAQFTPLVSKKHSLQSLTGFTVLPTIYGSTYESEDDVLSECSYVTGRAEDSFDDDSAISSSSSAYSEAESAQIKNIFQDNNSSTDHKVLSNIINNEEQNCTRQSLLQELILFAVLESKRVQTKLKGAKDNQPVAKFIFSECVWTFSGSFIIIFLLCFLSSNITLWNEHGHAFPLGPFGALTTLQYSLGDAAPAQPRNVILGSTLSGCVALCSTYISESILPPSIRIALATSTSIALMARFGIMHPPGGAIALVFAVGHYHWGHLLLTIGGCCIAVFLATIVNNLNKERQYPQYWDFTAALKQSL